MEKFKGKKIILWDFDGVIVDSSKIRIKGFKETLKDFPSSQVEELIKYHKANGGLSRYVKYRYFFDKIRGEEISEEKVQQLSAAFSAIMKKDLTDKRFLIPEVLNFIQKNHKSFIMHIVSGSDETELKYLCRQLEIEHLFKSINGSPVPKIELVKTIISSYNYVRDDVCLIGDSINDYEAARESGIDFFGYNNRKLNTPDKNYIFSFNEDF